MSIDAFTQIAGLVAVSFSLAFAVLLVLSRTERNRTLAPSLFATPPRDGIVFLFDDSTLINATDQANDLLADVKARGSDWERFVTAFGPRFPEIESQINALPELGHIVVHSIDGSTILAGDWRNGLTRVSLIKAPTSDSPVELDRASFASMQAELETLRATAENAPFLVWRQREDGKITWANNAYLDLAGKGDANGDAPVWPPARLFDLANTQSGDDPLSSRRVTAHIGGEAEPRWFECFEARIGDQSLFTAISADKVVKAEVTLRNFVQTLTKTFAHLTVGLAIFDKQRQLTLFNPALADLTGLPIDFLSAKPTLLAVLDRLRENKMVPEPKDYKSWRRELYALEAAAIDGTYEDTWSLANGSTYRVVGRPHPDGALAFLFEDISAEVSLTRRFRLEIETGQAILDSLDEAIAVFSPSGALLYSNAQYCRLWDVTTDRSLVDPGSSDALAMWADRSEPTQVWSDAGTFAGLGGERKEWSASVRLLDGRKLVCRFKPVSGGATMVEFRDEHMTLGHDMASLTDQRARQNNPATA